MIFAARRRIAGRRRAGQGAVGVIALFAAFLLVLAALVILVAHLTAKPGGGHSRVEIAAKETCIEKVYIGRAGSIGFLLRGPGAAQAGAFRRDAEGRSLTLLPGEMIARIDAYNFSDETISLVDGEWVLRIDNSEIRPLPPKGETEPPSPLHAALSGGELAASLPAHSARRVGFVCNAELFEHGAAASFRRGKIGDDVVLQPAHVSERELAEFDRSPMPAALERLAGTRAPAGARR